jgi:hypothetical protein
MATAAIVAAALTTPATRTLSVFAGGLDITGDVKWSSVSLTDSGTNAKGTADMTIERAASALPEITDQAMLRVEDHTLAASPEVFRGFIRARTPGKDPLHPTLSIIADDLTSLLDDAFIPVELRQPETMQARIGFFWGQYAGRFLSGDLSFVASVGSTLPIQRFEAVSLRQAIEMTIAQASSTADYYVDMLGRLHVFVTETNNAPFAIDADAPGGGEIAPETMAVEFDSNQYANRVYVKGATPEASLFVQDEASIAAANGLVRTVVIQASDVTTETMAQAMGTMYLGRIKDATPRGSFRTHSPNDGWRGGQNVTVTSADHNITAQTYRIARVTTRVLNPGTDFKRTYDVEFGGAKAGSGLDGQLPLIAGANSGTYILDQLGDSIISSAASSQVGVLGPSTRRYILSGIYNSDFYAPPPGPDAPIDDTTNPLPYWSKTVSAGTAARYLSTLDTSAASGRRLTASITTGTGTDTSYMTQRVPVLANEALTSGYMVHAFVTNTGGTTSANLLARLRTGFVTVGGTPLTSTNADVTLASLGASGSKLLTITPGSGFTPDTAYYLDVSLGLHRTSSSDTGEVEFAAVQMNQSPMFLGCWADSTATQVITTGSFQPVAFDEDLRDSYGMHDEVTNNSRFTVPWTGKYLCIGQFGWQTAAVGAYRAGWSTNGGAATILTYEPSTPAPGGVTYGQCVLFSELTAGSYFELHVRQDTGADNTLVAGSTATIYYLGEAGS